jgi:predicted MPP superfamily phosphohydrolase
MTPEARVRRAVDLSNAEEPDLVLMTGDYVCRSKRWVGAMGEQLRGLEAKQGVVTTLGNHDYWCDADGVTHEMRHNGYDMLRNQNTTLNVRGAPLTIVGIDDAVTDHDDPVAAYEGAHQGGTQLCLTHCPEVGPAAAALGADLIVSGHTHGGHLHHRKATPWLYQKLTGRKYLSGFYELEDGARLYVNRGVGASVFSPRVGEGARSEVAVFVLRRGPSAS